MKKQCVIYKWIMKLIDKDALSMELMNEVLNAYAKADFRFAHALCAKIHKKLKQHTARTAAQKWKIMEMTMMNKYIQQFLDDNDLQAGERFYILDKDYKKMFNKTFYINKNATGTDDILLDNNHFAIYSDTLLYLLTGIAFVKKKPFCPKYGEMVYYVTVSGYIQEVRFDTDSTLHQLLRKAGKLYRSEEEAKRYLDKDYKDLIIQEEE